MFLHCPTTNYKERTDPVVSNTSLSMGGSILIYELRQPYWLGRCYTYTGAFLQDLSKKKASPQHVGWEWELSPGIMDVGGWPLLHILLQTSRPLTYIKGHGFLSQHPLHLHMFLGEISLYMRIKIFFRPYRLPGKRFSFLQSKSISHSLPRFLEFSALKNGIT